MKKLFFILITFAGIIFLLEDCRRDPLIVNNQHSDADSLYTGTPYILQKPFHFPNITNPYKDSMTDEGIELGRRLFYDQHLSSTANKSCASCHHLQYALSDSGFAKSINVFGPTARNAQALQNLAWAPLLFWDGRSPTLAAQADDAFQHELGFMPVTAISYLQTDSIYTRLFRKAFGRPGDITANKIYLALQQFMMTATASNSKFDRVQIGTETFTTSEQNGFNMFITERGDCFHCHSDGYSLLMTDNKFHNNGLDTATSIHDFPDAGRGAISGDANDYGKFRSPSLRNITRTGPYMHDGRFKTLEQVINFYSDSIRLSPTIDPIMLKPNHVNGGSHFTAQEKLDLLNFLYTLTDDSMTVNAKLKNPF